MECDVVCRLLGDWDGGAVGRRSRAEGGGGTVEWKMGATAAGENRWSAFDGLEQDSTWHDHCGVASQALNGARRWQWPAGTPS